MAVFIFKYLLFYVIIEKLLKKRQIRVVQGSQGTKSGAYEDM